MTPRATVLGVLSSLALAALSSPVSAQSKRYPAPPVDNDAERSARSGLWTSAVVPERAPYNELVQRASELLGQRNGPVDEPIKKLDEAIKLLPREPDAYVVRGEAFFDRRDWAKCAADLSAADAFAPRRTEPTKVMIERHRKLGVCQAKAGQLGAAEQTLAETIALGNATGEIWMRLGEIRIAMGKLDEAIAALKSALDNSEQQLPPALVHFLLATAYDRARRPADAVFEIGEATRVDRNLSLLQSSPTSTALQPLNSDDVDYMRALAYSIDGSRPEFALALFRNFVKTAATSPWRRRAEEHIRDIKTGELPETIVKGGQPFDADAVRNVARRAMPQMRACLSGFPTVVVEVELSRAGPRTPPTDRARPKWATPPDGVTVRRVIGELKDPELDAIDRCLQPIVSRLAVPVVKERDTFYKAAFHVVGP